MSQNPRRNTIPPRRLINDFDEEAGQEEEVVPEEEPLEWDEIPPKKKKRDATARRRAPASPAPSEARTTSVLDRMGRRLTEHDLRMKLDRIHAQNDERRLKGICHSLFVISRTQLNLNKIVISKQY